MRSVWLALTLSLFLGQLICMGDERPGNNQDELIDRVSGFRLSEYPPNEHHIEDIMNAWWAIKQVMTLKHIGITLMSTFLRLYPEYMKYFSSGHRLRPDQLTDDVKFSSAAVQTIYALSSVLDNLDDAPLVNETMFRIGKMEAHRNLSEETVFDFRNLILHLISRYQKQHSHQFPPDLVESATRTLDWIFSIMLSGMRHQRSKIN